MPKPIRRRAGVGSAPFWTKLAKIYPCCGAIPVPDQMPARMFIGQKVHLQDTAAAAWTEHGA